jgi:solute:Na+ symporter, SSS family
VTATGSLRWIDGAVVCGYLLGLTLLGLRFSRRQTSTEQYFVAKRSIPSWAMGLSLLATLITSVTFIAYPGSAYNKNWSLLVPGLMVLPIMALLGAIVIPFYRQEVGMSAYEYFGKRFGQPTRMYSSAAFALGHFSKMGFVLYLVALTVNSMTGWNVEQIIVVVGALTILYTLKGGLEAVIWTDFVQGIILWIGIAVCLGFLLFLPPGGPGAVLSLAAENHKFSLGAGDFDFSKPTIPVLVLYGFFWYMQKFTADQTVVQRYLVAKNDRSALKGVAMGSLLCIPVWALFMLIGTCTWSFYKLTGEQLPAYVTKPDQAFPAFLTTHMPLGVGGVIMAALLGAAMCALSSDLNSLSAVGVEDIYRYLRPRATDVRRLRVGKIIVAGCGACCVATAIALAQTKGSALSMWYTVSAVASCGLAGLFLLAFTTSRASRRGVYAGIFATLAFTVWASLTLPGKRVIDLGRLNFPWHDYMVGALGNVILFAVGYGASLLMPDRGADAADSRLRQMTVWHWLRARAHEQQVSAGVPTRHA